MAVRVGPYTFSEKQVKPIRKERKRKEVERQIKSGKPLSPGARAHAEKELAAGRPIVKRGPKRTPKQLTSKRQQNLAKVLLGERRLVKPVPATKVKIGPNRKGYYPGGKTTEYDRFNREIKEQADAEARKAAKPVKALGLNISAVAKPLAGLAKGAYNLNRDMNNVKVAPDHSAASTKAILTVLDQTSRPYYGVTAGADALVRGKRIDKAVGEVGKGLRLKKRKEAWDVLESAGVKNKYVKYGAGVPAAFLADPASYVSVGAAPATAGGSLAGVGAKGAKVVRALNKGSKAKKAVDIAGKTGLRVTVGPRVPFSQKRLGGTTSGRTTAKLGQKVPKRVKDLNRSRPALGLKEAFVPDAQREGLTKADSLKVQQAEREVRASQHLAAHERKQTEKEIFNALRRDLGISKARKVLRPKDTRKRVDDRGRELVQTLERGTTDPGKVGRAIGQKLKILRKDELEAGIPTPKYAARSKAEAKTYVPREKRRNIERDARKQADKIARLEGKIVKTGGGRINPAAPYATERTVRGKLEDIGESGSPEDFSRNLPGVIAKRTSDSILDRARVKYNKTLLETGRKVEKGDPTELNPGEGLYKYNPKKPQEGLSEVSEAAGEGEFFVLSRHAVKESKQRIAQAGELTQSGVGRAFDKSTGRWKGLVTVLSPAYYLRNLIGDTMLAGQADTDAKSIIDSARIARAAGKRNRIQRSGKTITEGKDADAALKKLKIKVNGKKVSAYDIEKMATETGAVGGGTIGGEVAQLVGSESLSANNPLARANIGRENLPRRATFLAAMKRGDDPRAASRYANKHHYDYGDLTSVEQKIRRAVPFYTFWARNTRRQLTQLVTRPGKTNNIYHVMNAAASSAGFENYQDYVQNLPEAQQRGLPIPVKVNGQIKNLQFGNILTDLQVLTPNALEQFYNVAGRVHPLKTLAELATNKSMFYRDDIEQPYSPDTAAPDFVKNLPPGVRNALHLVERVDRKSGQSRVAWNKKLDYALRQLGPQASFLLSQLTSKPSGPFEQSRTDALIGLSGVRPTNYYDDQNRINQLYKQRQELMDKRSGFSGRADVPEQRKKALNEQIKKVSDEITKTETAAGYKKPLGSGRKKSSNPLDQLERALKSSTPDPLEQLEKALSAAPSTTKTVAAKPAPKKPVNVARVEAKLAKAGKREAAKKAVAKTKALAAKAPPQTRPAVVTAVSNTNTGSGKAPVKTATASRVSVASGGSTKGFDPDLVTAIERHADKIDGLAQREYGIDGATLLKKLYKGESGGRKNAVSSAGARGWGQFMPGSRKEAMKHGVDPWASADEAVQGTILHLQGKINGKTGLAGYNPGMASYTDYILGQKVGDIGRGKATTSPQSKTPTVSGSANKAAIAQYLLNPKKKGAAIELAMALRAESGTKTARASSRATTSGSGGSDPWKAALSAGAKVSSARRPGAITSAGNVSDHSGAPGSGTMARDFTGDLPKIAKTIARSLGIKNYKPGSIVNVTKGGYRYQLIYKIPDGSHDDHVHLGRKPV